MVSTSGGLLAVWLPGMSAAGSLALAVMTSGGGGRADLRRHGVHWVRLSLFAVGCGSFMFRGKCTANGGRGCIPMEAAPVV